MLLRDLVKRDEKVTGKDVLEAMDLQKQVLNKAEEALTHQALTRSKTLTVTSTTNSNRNLSKKEATEKQVSEDRWVELRKGVRQALGLEEVEALDSPHPGDSPLDSQQRQSTSVSRLSNKIPSSEDSKDSIKCTEQEIAGYELVNKFSKDMSEKIAEAAEGRDLENFTAEDFENLVQNERKQRMHTRLRPSTQPTSKWSSIAAFDAATDQILAKKPEWRLRGNDGSNRKLIMKDKSLN
jgi:hypothetical protein